MNKPSETPIVDALIGTFYMRCDECPQPEKCERAQFVNPDDARQLERSNVALVAMLKDIEQHANHAIKHGIREMAFESIRDKARDALQRGK